MKIEVKVTQQEFQLMQRKGETVHESIVGALDWKFRYKIDLDTNDVEVLIAVVDVDVD